MPPADIMNDDHLPTCPVSYSLVQVMIVPSQQRKLMKAALEMAVQESLSHPNIVRVYGILTDVIQDCGEQLVFVCRLLAIGGDFRYMHLFTCTACLQPLL